MAKVADTIILRFPACDIEAPIKKIIELHGIKCTLHRQYFATGITDGWVVSEITTGMAVDHGDTMGDAIADAQKKEKQYNLKDWNLAIKKAAGRLKKRKLEVVSGA